MPGLICPAQRPLLLAAVILGLVLPAVERCDERSPQPSVRDLEQRLAELEATVQQFQQERRALFPANYAPPWEARWERPDPGPPDVQNNSAGPNMLAQRSAAADPTGPHAADRISPGGTTGFSFTGWEDGFVLRSPDRRFILRITGQTQADYRSFLDGGDQTDVDTFLVRRARLGIEANMLEVFEFRLLPDFTNAQAPGIVGSPRLQDAFLNVHYVDAFQIQAGKFKQPFSYEQLMQDRFVPVMERSLIDQLAPARDAGVMIHGRGLGGDRFEYAVSMFNGDINGDFDTNDRKDLAARLAVRPFHTPNGAPLLQTLQLGISAATGIEQRPVQPSPLRTPATVPWLQFNPGVQINGLRNRWSPEVSWFYGPLGFAAQSFHMAQTMQPPPSGTTLLAPVRVRFDGFYVLATLLLTGEHRTTFNQAIDPLRPFDPRCRGALGAWELIGRVSRLTVGDVVFATGSSRLADPALFTSGATELTLGFNWYLNKWVRLQFNWEHAWFDDPVRLGFGPGGLLHHQDSLLTRFQVIF